MRMKPLAYLAVPYSHDDTKVMQERFEKVNIVAAKLMENGELIFSPISHCHPIKLVGNLPREFDYWLDFDSTFLRMCHKLYVLKLDGWENSKGVHEELNMAEDLGMTVEFLNFEDFVEKA